MSTLVLFCKLSDKNGQQRIDGSTFSMKSNIDFEALDRGGESFTFFLKRLSHISRNTQS